MDKIDRKQLLDNLIAEHNAHIEAANELRERIKAIRAAINREIYGDSIGYQKDMPKIINEIEFNKSNPYGI